VQNDPSNFVIFENVNPPIIDEAVFEKVQQIRQSGKRRINHSGRVSLFSGIAYCAECKSKLYFSCGASLKPEQDNYVCSGFRTKSAECDSSHYIRKMILEEAVLTHIQKVTAYATEHESDFVQKLQQKSNDKFQKELALDKKTLVQTEKRIQELDVIIQRLYEDNVAGKLSDERFVKMSQNYENEQKESAEKLELLRVQVSKQQENHNNIKMFLERVQKYTQLSELTTLIINELIDRVEVHSADKSSGKRIQRVDVYFNYVGLFELPDEPLPKNPTYLLTEQIQLQSIKND
jgi:hypothetical protein